ncbi:class I SAM-dependent methyltransferase [Kribbella sp. NPDC051718]|uniref:class I SAM-dependent methyltransferase n=1 Tax=Kribbella sp. NPDC051718 TaxID=3155168 RepID=UPI00342DE84C
MSRWAGQLDALRSGLAQAWEQRDIWYLMTSAGLRPDSLAEARPAVELVLARTGTLEGKRLADLGCGVGRHLYWFDRLAGSKNLGLDSSRMLAEHASSAVPAVDVVVQDFAGLAEFGAFDVVCAFAHSLFLTDSMDSFRQSLRAIRGAMPDYGVLVIEQQPVSVGRLEWTTADGLSITQLIDRQDAESFSHQLTVEYRGAVHQDRLSSIELPASAMAAVAAEAGFLLEATEQLDQKGGFLTTVYFLRAQRGYNYLSDLPDFLRSWTDPDHWRNSERVIWDTGSESRRKPVGELALQQGASLSRHHQDFAYSIEPRIRPLVLELVRGWDFVTYSSCEAHLVDSVPVEVFSEAYCGVVTFSNRQIAVVEELVRRSAEFVTATHLRVCTSRRNLYGPDCLYTAVDVRFEPSSNLTRWVDYRIDLDRVIAELGVALTSIRSVR